MSVINSNTANNRNDQSNAPQTGTGNANQSQRSQDGNHRNQNKPRFNRNRNGGRFSNNKSSNHFVKTSVFQGETSGLNGCVFQMQSESKDPTQFKRTVEALERFCDKIYDVDMRSLFGSNPTVPVIERPTRPDDETADALDKDAYREEVKQYVKDKKSLSKSLRALYSVIWGQCSVNVITKLSSLPDVDEWKEQGSCHELLKAIQQILMDYEHKKCIYVTLLKQIKFLYAYKQRDNQSLHKYFEVFQIMTENIERYGGSFGNHPAYVKDSMEKAGIQIDDPDVFTDELLKEHERKAQQKFLGISFLLGGRNDMYEDLVIDLENDYLKGNDHFPSSVNEEYQLMSNFSKKKGSVGAPQVNRRYNGVGFLQNSTTGSDKSSLVPGVDGITHKDIQCWTCKGTGHYSNKCPNKGSVNLLQTAPANHDGFSGHLDHQGNPDVSDTESIAFGFLQVSFSQLKHDWTDDVQNISKNWVLLDSQSNCDIFCNKNLLTNIRQEKGPGLTLQTNGGTLKSDLVGDVKGYGKVWYNPASLANILSLANVRKRFHITMATGPSDPVPKIIVHKTNGDKMVFFEHEMGLFVHDPTKLENSNVNLEKVLDYSFFTNLVSTLENQFTKQEVKKAQEAQTLYKRLGRPSIKKFQHIIRHNLIRNCPISLADALRCEYIYGPDPSTIKGKAVRVTPPPVRLSDVVPVPPHILQFHSNITLCVDILFVQGTPFLTTISERICFRTVEELGARNYKCILNALQKVINVYDSRELHIQHIKGDSEFECIRDSVLPCLLHVCAVSEHVPTVERSIRTIKEHARTIIHGLPFTYYPPILLRYLLYFVARVLNSFPASNGVCNTHSPLTILTGSPSASATEFKVEFGSYVQVHDNDLISNTTASRSTGALALSPANSNGGWYFLSLATGERLLRYSWTECRITNDIINRVHNIANNAHLSTHDILQDFDFHISGANVESRSANAENEATNRSANAVNNDEINDENEDVDEEGEQNENENQADHNNVQDHRDPVITDDEANDEASMNASATEENEAIEQLDEEQEEQLQELFDIEPKSDEENKETTENADDIEVKAGRDHQIEVPTITEEPMGSEAVSPSDNNEQEDSKDLPSVPTRVLRSMKDALDKEVKRYNLRGKVKKARDDAFNKRHYNYLMFTNKSRSRKRYVQRMKEREFRDLLNVEMSKERKNVRYSKEKVHRALSGLCLTQMSATKGIRVYGDKAVKAMAKEYAQLDELGVFKGRMPGSLKPEERKAALQVIDLIKEKRCGRIKGRSVVDGRGQRGSYEKIDTSSKALTLEAFITTIAIDAFEGRDVATADVAGAFLKADQPDFVLIKLRGPAVKAILEVNKDKYIRYVTEENGVIVMYLELLKAMYGTLTAPILWYKLFAASLLEMGFVINDYDACVANKVVKGHQLTVCWYVDDLKVSHKCPEVVSELLLTIEQKFGKMTVKRGNVQTYLGMDIEIVDRKIKICMKTYLQECIDSFGESLTSNATTPANKNLMELDEESCKLNTQKRELFHHIVQKLLHISKRGRLDLQVAIGFLCTRVKEPNVSDWNKLRRTLQYIRGTLDMSRILSIGNIELMNIYIDASHGIHWNRRGQTGGCISMGDGLLHARSTKQGINTKSSTETEFVGNSEYLPYAIWLLNFLECQGYTIKRKLLHQDNESAIKLLKNGVVSATKRSRHVDIRYFWTTDRIKDLEMEVVYCPTEKMLGDFFTKPLQGKLFRLMRDIVQGIKPYSALMDDEAQKKRKLEFDKENIDEEVHNKNMLSSTYRQERVENVKEERSVKSVRFDDEVEKGITPKTMKNVTYSDVVRTNMSQINYDKYMRM